MKTNLSYQISNYPLIVTSLSLNFHNPFLTFIKNVHLELGRHGFIGQVLTTNMEHEFRSPEPM